jgi:hypothetical protein
VFERYAAFDFRPANKCGALVEIGTKGLFVSESSFSMMIDVARLASS